MSNLSLRSAFKEDKFNLKTITVVLILIDVSLLPIFLELELYGAYLNLLLYQGSIILGLLFGLRGLARYKGMMFELQSIVKNQEFDIDERDARLVQIIHHACLELGLNFEVRNKKYGLFKFKKKQNYQEEKKTKKKEVKRKVFRDEIVKKQFGYMVVGIWGFLGVALLDLLINFWVLAPLWIFAITGIWYCVDAFILFYFRYVFNIPQQELVIKVPDSTIQHYPYTETKIE